MSLFPVVQRLLDKAGTSFIEPRREDGHGSSALTPTFVDTGLTTQTDALTDAELRAAPVPVATGLTQPTTPADTQPVSVAALPLPTGAATEAKQDAGNTSLLSIDGKLPDLSGAWGYDAGVSGSVTIGAGKRVLQITAVAGALGATMTINGGSTVTIPALTSITIEPRGNLTAPSLVFTGTAAYLVEHVS